jgi:enamine deaminase RidA (YjgF/YER057c/UK114 family)
VERRRIASGSPFEPVIGFSRALAVGNRVYVSGTAPIMPDLAEPPSDPYGQARRVMEIILAALQEAGAWASDVVRTRTYLVREQDYPDVARAHAEVFGEARPASTFVVVRAFLDPRWLVEMEADAVIDAP